VYSTSAPWRVSSWSKSGNCVEVANFDRSIAIRDTKDREGRVLSFSPIVWERFIEQSRQIRLDQG
jgi:hypothetical protein